MPVKGLYLLVWCARVEFVQAIVACVRQHTDTLVIVHQVNASATIAARVGGAIVYVDLTVCADVAGLALAKVAVESVDALATVLARVAATLVYVELTTFTFNGPRVSVILYKYTYHNND